MLARLLVQNGQSACLLAVGTGKRREKKTGLSAFAGRGGTPTSITVLEVPSLTRTKVVLGSGYLSWGSHTSVCHF